MDICSFCESLEWTDWVRRWLVSQCWVLSRLEIRIWLCCQVSMGADGGWERGYIETFDGRTTGNWGLTLCWTNLHLRLRVSCVCVGGRIEKTRSSFDANWADLHSTHECHLQPSLPPKLYIKTTRTTGRRKMRRINHAQCELETAIRAFWDRFPHWCGLSSVL